MSITIIIPNFNKGLYIRETLNSVISQSFTDWEAIVVDDGSDDNSKSVVRSFVKEDKRFTFYERDRLPKGASTCRNIGLERAKNDLIIFLDSDDLLANYCLQQRMDIIEKFPQQDFIIFPSIIFEKKANDLMRLVGVETKRSLRTRILGLEVPWTISSVIWRKSALDRLEGFDENLTAKQDPDLIVRALKERMNFEVLWNQVPDFFYRISSSSIGLSTNKTARKNRLSSSEFIVSFITQHFDIRKDKDVNSGLGSAIMDLIDEYCQLKLFGKANKLVNYYSIYPSGVRLILRVYIFLSSLLDRSLPGFYSVRKHLLRKYFVEKTYATKIYSKRLIYKNIEHTIN